MSLEDQTLAPWPEPTSSSWHSRMMPELLETTIDTGETRIFAVHGGRGPPLMLLHGFPETHLMWREIVPILARSFSVVAMDLRGYGQSSCPDSSSDHSPYSKRSLARDVMRVMERLGHRRFSVAGHDRGGRVAYRLALDHPDRIEKLAVLDIVVGSDAWKRADDRLALSFWPWSLLAQAAPLPERMLECAAQAIIDDAATNWGSSKSAFPEGIRSSYASALADPQHAHAICEEYRAAATIDRIHDEEDRAAGRRIASPMLVLWAANNALDSWYKAEGGPLALWRQWANVVQGEAVEGGHFFPELHPEETASRLGGFFAG